eukprot:TRINITY_DN94754_c0_g1_i1.p1 TRINITY_DN94754_c0_g1~~TRINITY_DN94754_c0_g1_i1.p1  ORF type:complete len:566 (+),score=132.85 TRINITY_DN94754_c0_g1_i1:66-1700(+)
MAGMMGGGAMDANMQAQMAQAQQMQLAYAQAMQAQAGAMQGQPGAMQGQDPTSLYMAQLAQMQQMNPMAMMGMAPNPMGMAAGGMAAGATPAIASRAFSDEPPAKRARHPQLAEGAGEVRFESPQSAMNAKQTLDGSLLGGQSIKVMLDANSQDGTKILVFDLPPTVEWQELKDHFSQCGTVAFANTGNQRAKGAGKGYQPAPLPPGSPPVGEVRFTNPEDASAAIVQFNGSEFLGKIISVQADQSSTDGSKLLIYDLPDEAQWQELKDHFGSVGRVAYAGIRGGSGGKGGGKGKGPSPVLTELQNSDPSKACGEVRYAEAIHAQQAVMMLHGSFFGGNAISVVQDIDRDGTKVYVGGVAPGSKWQDLKDHFGAIGKVEFVDIKPPQSNPQLASLQASVRVGPIMGPGGAMMAPQHGMMAPGAPMMMNSPMMMGSQMMGNQMMGQPMMTPMGGAAPGGTMKLLGEVRFADPSMADAAKAELNGSFLKGTSIQVHADPKSLDGCKVLVTGLTPAIAWQDLKDHLKSCGTVAFATIHKGIDHPLLH